MKTLKVILDENIALQFSYYVKTEINPWEPK
jgi:hypothetical protein